MVRMGSFSRPLINAFRKRPTCTSTVRSPTSADMPQMLWRSCARVKTRPGFSRRDFEKAKLDRTKVDFTARPVDAACLAVEVDATSG